MTYQQRAHLWLSCIQQEFVALLPVLFLGALALTFVQIPQYYPGLESHIVFNIASFVVSSSYGFISLFLVASISYQLADHHIQRLDLSMTPFMMAIMSLMTLVIMLYMSKAPQASLSFGFEHIIHAVVVGIIFTEAFVLFLRFYSIRFSYLEHEINGQLSTTIRMIVPSVIVPVLMIVVYYFVFMDSAYIETVTLWVIGPVNAQEGLSGWQSVKVILINQLAWFVGIHGSSLIATVSDVLFTTVNVDNFNGEMISHFAYLGGSGCTLGLVMTLFFSRRKSNRHFAKYAIIPSLFNINELVIFGLPIVLNRFLLFPFLLIPILAIGITYLSVSLGLLEFTNHNVVWSMPFLLGGYLLTEHWSGAILQLVICVISGLVYWPFLKRYEVHQNQQQAEKIKGLITQLSDDQCDMKTALKAPGELGIFCRRIAKDLASTEHLELYYQPKVNSLGKVEGAEALLRWDHPVYGCLPPSLFIPIAEACGQIHTLGMWVIERSLKDMGIMDRSYGFTGIPFAINVSPLQFNRDDFFNDVKACINRYGVDPKRIELEITEGQRLFFTDKLVSDLRQLTNMGVRIAVDDFGMGHTSLHYLRSFPVHGLKIDGDIIKDVVDSAIIQEIVQSMVNLAHGMGAVLIAEWVEQQAQLDMLHTLGCDQYQGAHFSMPMPLPQLVAYCVKHQK